MPADMSTDDASRKGAEARRLAERGLHEQAVGNPGEADRLLAQAQEIDEARSFPAGPRRAAQNRKNRRKTQPDRDHDHREYDRGEAARTEPAEEAERRRSGT